MKFLDYDIVLTYAYSNLEKKRISGHLFEVLDYYLYLKDNGYKVKIIIQDFLTREEVLIAWRNHYNISESNIDFIVLPNPKRIMAKKILNTSGYGSYEDCVYVGKLYQFRCGVFSPEYIERKKITVLQDTRVYPEIASCPRLYKHYIKKINTKYMKKVGIVGDRSILYLNTLLRSSSKKFLQEKKELYPDLTIISNIIDKSLAGSIPVLKPPVNILSIAKEYIYTETMHMFDCSPRLIFECAFNNIPVHYDFSNINKTKEEYMEIDSGLKYRYLDIKNNIESLSLNEDDDLKELIWE